MLQSLTVLFVQTHQFRVRKNWIWTAFITIFGHNEFQIFLRFLHLSIMTLVVKFDLVSMASGWILPYGVFLILTSMANDVMSDDFKGFTTHLNDFMPMMEKNVAEDLRTDILVTPKSSQAPKETWMNTLPPERLPYK